LPMGKIDVPAFVGIGMAKSGTSWLDSVLRQHPGIWMPPVKELHFFDDYFWYVLKGDRSRYFSRDSYSRERWRRYLLAETKRAIRFPSASNAAWALRFLFRRRSIETYKMLFKPGAGRICGEFTPAYSVLSRSEIEQVHAQYPRLKILLVLRNPAERAWSHAKMELGTRMKRAASDIPVSELDCFLFDNDKVKAKGEYTKILTNWSEVFGKENIFVALHDEIKSAPGPLLEKLFAFLGLDPAAGASINLAKLVFAGPPGNPPSDVQERLQGMYASEIRSVSEFLGRPELVELWR
jgi:hypothetical protein